MGELGEFFGWLIIIAYGITIMNYILKEINKRYSKQIAKSPNFKKYYSMLMKIIVKQHKWFGFATIAFILIHFINQFSRFGLNILGVIAAGVMVLQVLLGAFGAYKVKKRSGWWFKCHRAIAILLFVTIFIHVL